MLKIATLGAAVAFAALSIFGITAAQAQNATSCPGGSDPNARACLQINLNGVQQSLIEINEQDALDNPGMMWMIGGLVETDTTLLHDWIAVSQPGGAVSDIVGIPSDGTIAFISGPADFSPFDHFNDCSRNLEPDRYQRLAERRGQGRRLHGPLPDQGVSSARAVHLGDAAARLRESGLSLASGKRG